MGTKKENKKKKIIDSTLKLLEEFDNPEDIKYIVENIQSHQMKKDGIKEVVYEYRRE